MAGKKTKSSTGDAGVSSRSLRRGLMAVLAAALLLLSLLLLSVLPAAAANPDPVQIYYTPVKEAQLLPLLNATSGNAAPVSPILLSAMLC